MRRSPRFNLMVPVGIYRTDILGLRNLACSILCLASVLLSASPQARAEGFENCAEYVAMGVPGDAGSPLCRIGYALAHDPSRKTPIWVAERLTRERAMADATRKDKFAPDPDLLKGMRAELADYKGTGYDRGHMAPNADFNWSAEAAAESFYLSNMVPQVGRGMNQGIWKELEAAVRLWAVRRGQVYVYTGPIYEGRTKTIGKGRVAVPNALYKIVFDPETLESATFIMPNKVLKLSDLMQYVSSISEVEDRTGLIFLSDVALLNPADIKNKKAVVTWEK